MARDKLITVRIEGEKREAFNQLAKSQNTDTASLLYDFINQCLDGTIDIKLVTGKKQWIDKIDNQLDTNRLDKLEATTQEIDNRLDTIAKRLDDWIEAIDDRVTDCDQVLSEKIISLEHRINALSSQLDSQKDRQKDRQEIDTDSQEIDDMEPLLKLQREASIADHSPDEPAIVPPNEPNAIEAAIETAIKTDDREWLTLQQIADKKINGLPGTHEGLRPHAKNWESRKNPKKRGKQYKIPREYLTPISPNPD
jgi:exonuclease VII large subunit